MPLPRFQDHGGVRARDALHHNLQLRVQDHRAAAFQMLEGRLPSLLAGLLSPLVSTVPVSLFPLPLLCVRLPAGVHGLSFLG